MLDPADSGLEPAEPAEPAATPPRIPPPTPARGFRHFRETSPRYAAISTALTFYVSFYVALIPAGKQPGIVHLTAAAIAVFLLVGGLLAPKVALGFHRRFREFRRTRPFWSALWMAAGGLELFWLTKSPPKGLPHVGVGGIYGMGAGIVLMLLGVVLLAVPSQHFTIGIFAVVVGVASFPLSNLGGFFLGMILSILGGSMAFGWMPEKPEKRTKRRLFRRLPRAAQTAPAAPMRTGAPT